jgi:hypothetical protein
MPRTVTNETRIDDPALIEKVAIAIFEKTQGSWEYAREADRECHNLFEVHRGTRSFFPRPHRKAALFQCGLQPCLVRRSARTPGAGSELLFRVVIRVDVECLQAAGHLEMIEGASEANDYLLQANWQLAGAASIGLSCS